MEKRCHGFGRGSVCFFCVAGGAGAVLRGWRGRQLPGLERFWLQGR